MWNYNIEEAKRLLEPWRHTVFWHAGAYAECIVLRVVLTGQRSEALAAMDLVRTAEALRDNRGEAAKNGAVGSNDELDVFSAELLLLRSGLQVILGHRLRAIFNLRQSWYLYRRLESHLAAPGKCATLSAEDWRGRVTFGLGFFYLATSLLPVGLGPLMRLAGFIMHRTQGKAYLAECVERDLGPRAALAAVLLAMYHLDLEPDIPRAGDLLVASLGRRPENVLLHWAGSVLAWRNTCINQAAEMTAKALWCCGEELGEQAIYLRYELGMFNFISMQWSEAYLVLCQVSEVVRTGDRFFPYRSLVRVQLAAAAFAAGKASEGEALCRDCASSQDWIGAVGLESDFAKLMQIFLKHRVGLGRRLLAFEVMYLLRQFPKIPASMLLEIQAEIKRIAQPCADQLGVVGPSGNPHPGHLEAGAVVEYASAQTLRCIILFYLGEAEQALEFVPALAQLCSSLPQWCAYISAHGLYWCGRILALGARRSEAVRCLSQAKALKKYPFHIGIKISKVLEALEQAPNR